MVNANPVQILTSSISLKANLLIITLSIPFVGALFTGLLYKNKRLRNILVVLTCLITLVLTISMYEPVVKGLYLGEFFYRGIACTIPSILGVNLALGLDRLGFLFALITCLVWTFSILFATSYMSHEHSQGRFFLFMLLTFGANLLVFLTRDFFSLFVFFEFMTLFSYILVVHEESPEAMAAGRLYLVMSIIGGLFILSSILLLYFYTGTSALVPLSELVVANISDFIKYIIISGFIIGFGIKAGIFFLHAWLPEAHPIAPTPASAVLSGLIVKVGIYGIIRSIYTLFTPLGKDTAYLFTQLGYFLIWAGIITMFGGMTKAVLDRNCKRVLAYSTVSQMGYIILGIGCAAYLGGDGAMGVAGSLYHVINHALFKSALFLTIGVIYFYTKELNMNKLGGLWRDFPLTAIIYLIAGLSIAGFPGFGGFASKTMLHHAIVEAYQHSSHYSLLHQPDPWLRFAELMFLITASGTIYYISRMFIIIFLFKKPESLSKTELESETWPMKLALIPLALVIIFIGLWPNFLLEYLIGPTLSLFGLNVNSHAYHLIYNTHALSGLKSTLPLLYDPKTFSFLNAEILHNIQNVSIVIVGTLMYYMLDYGSHIFDISLPRKISIGYWYKRIFIYFISSFSIICHFFDTIWDKVISFGMVKIWIINY